MSGNYYRETIETIGWEKHLEQQGVNPNKFSKIVLSDLKIDGKVNIARLSRTIKRSYPTTRKWLKVYLKENRLD